jgi:hypothetical protein
MSRNFAPFLRLKRGSLSIMEILRQVRCPLRVNGRRYSRGSSSSSGAFRGRIPYPLTMRFSTSNWRGVWSVAAPASLTPSNRLKFEFLSLWQFSCDPQLTSVYRTTSCTVTL